MKQFLILFIILNFSSFTKEEIIIRNDNNLNCYNSVDDFVNEIRSNNYFNYFNNYGFNPQNCNLRKKNQSNKACCYIGLKYNGDWHYACAGVEMEKYKGSKFLKNYYEDELKQNLTNFDYNKYLKVDCFSKNLNIYILLFLIIIFLF